MNATRYSHTDSFDPVIRCIEECLQVFEKRGSDRLNRKNYGQEIELSFGAYSARAISYDIALVRLAKDLVEDPSYGSELQRALHPHLESHN